MPLPRGAPLAALLLAAALGAQGVLERSRVALPEDERRAIEDARRGARPRPFAKRRAPLGAAESERARAFDEARASVVQVASPAQGLGSGVVWDGLGHVVTSFHLVAAHWRPAAAGPSGPPGTQAGTRAEPRATGLVVRAPDGAEYAAEMVGAAPECGLALLRTDAPMKGAAPIRLGRSSDLAVGRAVMALGNPFGYDHSLTCGIVSALGRAAGSPAGAQTGGIIQTDAAINRGSSGGPLLDASGLMVGLCAALVSPSGWNAGHNYAVPSETVISEMARLLGPARAAEPLPPPTPREAASAGAFDRAKRSVVGVHTKELYRNLWTGFESLNPTGGGSGVLWDSKGHVVTSFHVIAQRDPATGGARAADAITVTAPDGRETAARALCLLPDIDIAVLKLEAVPEGMAPIALGGAAGPSVGQSVLALGSPFGNSHSLTAGVISALHRTIESPAGTPIRGALQTDAAINPGSSGGPLLDLAGRMLGINAMIFSASGASASVGFAIPVDLIRRGVEDLLGPREAAATGDAGGPGGLDDRGGVAVFKRARGSVVYVHAETRKFDFDGAWAGSIFRLPPSSGTGTVWDNSGHIVTSYRAVLMSDPLSGQMAEAERLTVTLADGRTYRARIIGRSLEYQVAVLRVFAPFRDLRPLPLLRPEDLKVGQDLYALGNPFGMDHSLSRGVLSAGRDLSHAIRGAIQTDAAINPGNIGGPILDSEGNLAGMGFFVEGPGSHAGVNFALTAGTLNRVVPILLAKGQVERPALGFVSVAEPEARRRFGVGRGVLVGSVDDGSPAARAGLRAGDVIVGLGGRPVANSDALWDLLEQEPPGAELPLDVLRGGGCAKVAVRPGE